jgi:hypothetical protein
MVANPKPSITTTIFAMKFLSLIVSNAKAIKIRPTPICSIRRTGIVNID